MAKLLVEESEQMRKLQHYGLRFASVGALIVSALGKTEVYDKQRFEWMIYCTLACFYSFYMAKFWRSGILGQVCNIFGTVMQFTIVSAGLIRSLTFGACLGGSIVYTCVFIVPPLVDNNKNKKSLGWFSYIFGEDEKMDLTEYLHGLDHFGFQFVYEAAAFLIGGTAKNLYSADNHTFLMWFAAAAFACFLTAKVISRGYFACICVISGSYIQLLLYGWLVMLPHKPKFMVGIFPLSIIPVSPLVVKLVIIWYKGLKSSGSYPDKTAWAAGLSTQGVKFMGTAALGIATAEILGIYSPEVHTCMCFGTTLGYLAFTAAMIRKLEVWAELILGMGIAMQGCVFLLAVIGYLRSDLQELLLAMGIGYAIALVFLKVYYYEENAPTPEAKINEATKEMHGKV